MTDIVQVIADVLASVDEDVYRDRLANRGMAWDATAAQYEADMARLRELRDHITRDRECQEAWARLRGRDGPLDRETASKLRGLTTSDLLRERALLAFCREVGT